MFSSFSIKIILYKSIYIYLYRSPQLVCEATWLFQLYLTTFNIISKLISTFLNVIYMNFRTLEDQTVDYGKHVVITAELISSEGGKGTFTHRWGSACDLRSAEVRLLMKCHLCSALSPVCIWNLLTSPPLTSFPVYSAGKHHLMLPSGSRPIVMVSAFLQTWRLEVVQQSVCLL